MVTDALKAVEPTRRCFRMIGGVLVERTVGETLPAVEGNSKQVKAEAAAAAAAAAFFCSVSMCVCVHSAACRVRCVQAPHPSKTGVTALHNA